MNEIERRRNAKSLHNLAGRTKEYELPDSLISNYLHESGLKI